MPIKMYTSAFLVIVSGLYDGGVLGSFEPAPTQQLLEL
jgi:hypothetical protein